MHFDIWEKRQDFDKQEFDRDEHPGEYWEDAEEENWAVLAIQAGYDGVFDEQYNE